MSNTVRALLPLLALDILGCMVMGAGLAAELADVHFLPEAWRVTHYGWMMAGAGAPLTIPFNREILRRAQQQKKQKQTGNPGIPGID